MKVNGNRSIGKALLVALLLTVAVVSATALTAGAVVKVYGGFLGVTKADGEKVSKLVAEKDTMGLLGMIDAKTAFLHTPYDGAKVVSVSGNMVEILVTSGDEINRKGWVSIDFVKDIQ